MFNTHGRAIFENKYTNGQSHEWVNECGGGQWRCCVHSIWSQSNRIASSRTKLTEKIGNSSSCWRQRCVDSGWCLDRYAVFAATSNVVFVVVVFWKIRQNCYLFDRNFEQAVVDCIFFFLSNKMFDVRLCHIALIVYSDVPSMLIFEYLTRFSHEHIQAGFTRMNS